MTDLREWLDGLDADQLLQFADGYDQYFTERDILRALATHLPALRRAVETQEAVEWCHGARVTLTPDSWSNDEGEDDTAGWEASAFRPVLGHVYATRPGDVSQAVAALRAKIEGGTT